MNRERLLLSFDEKGFYLNGEPFRIISGDIHYFRIHQSDWDKRLDMAVNFGLNTVQTYTPWNLHEPSEGVYDFDGMLDLELFLKKCDEKGLKVLLRPSPYICSECDLGGLPAWLLFDGTIKIRTSDELYMEKVERFYAHLIPKFLPYLSTNGGPIIAVAVENEYGNYATDREYIARLASILRDAGVDVPLYNTEGSENKRFFAYGGVENGFTGMNYRGLPGVADKYNGIRKEALEGSPYFLGEFWAGRSSHCGEPFARRDPTETSVAYREALERGANVNFYMFSGGTNFGFMGGALDGFSYTPRPDCHARYMPFVTSYDVDSLVCEDGTVGEKYYLCRDELDKYLGRPARPHTLFEHRTQCVDVELGERAGLFDNIDALTVRTEESLYPLKMEQMGQKYGLILYTQKADTVFSGLTVTGVKDRATLFVNGKYHATFMRDRGVSSDCADVFNSEYGNHTKIDSSKKGYTFDVLAENLGRICFGYKMMDEKKGIEHIVNDLRVLVGCTNRSIPLDDLSGIEWKSAEECEFKEHMPVFYRGRFDADIGADTYLSTKEFGHGYAWINGFNLGRYDIAGPQFTLYIPAGLLKEKDNELTILDIAPACERMSASLTDEHILDGDALEMV